MTSRLSCDTIIKRSRRAATTREQDRPSATPTAQAGRSGAGGLPRNPLVTRTSAPGRSRNMGDTKRERTDVETLKLPHIHVFKPRVTWRSNWNTLGFCRCGIAKRRMMGGIGYARPGGLWFDNPNYKGDTVDD